MLLLFLFVCSVLKGFVARNKQLVNGAERNAILSVKKGQLRKGGACKTTDKYCFAVTYNRHSKAPTLEVKAGETVWIKTDAAKTEETLRVTVDNIACSAVFEVSQGFRLIQKLN